MKNYWRHQAFVRMGLLVVLFPFLMAYEMLKKGSNYSNPVPWILLLVGVLFLIIAFQFVWLSHEQASSPPTPARLRQQRILAVADTVDDLPGGISLADLCERLDEKQTRKLLHQMQQTRPGNRHLRDTPHLWPRLDDTSPS